MSQIDPGLDEPAQQAAEDVEKNDRDNEEEKKQAKAEEDAYLDPSRWWLASTAFPLIAGTFGPIANAFSICALVVKWRVFIPDGSDEGHGQPIEDPKWLIAINSVSLVFALTANLALLLNMARRIRFGIAQGITIIGWYIASILLIALVAISSSDIFRKQPAERHALSQAYYYGLIAAGLYAIIASMQVMTVIGAYRGHYPKDFSLTSSQRTLMLQTISFVTYMMLGALVYSYIEDWPFLDAVFWANFTLLTIGLGGEFTPNTHAGRSLLFPFAIGGIIMVGLVVGSVRSLALERGKQKMEARLMETKRESVLESLDDSETGSTVRLGPFEKVKVPEGLSEAQRREYEFKVMRRVQQKADRRRRYVALAMSSTAALLLWFLGALVFWYAENPQGWSYFVSLYFSYTTLLTIGYGDFTPISNSGKPFFVFWTLLAVPTLTILISNMGDTVIRAFSDLVMWFGSITVLPNKGTMETLKLFLGRLRVGKLHKQENEDASKSTSEDAILRQLSAHIENDELLEAEEAGEHGDTLERDIRFYHFIVAREIRKVMKEVEISPPKQYTYSEWAYYLRLIGQDENDSDQHRPATIGHNREPHEPDLGTASGNKGKRWSWLGIRSPLMSNMSEPEWILERLTMCLEGEMRKMHKKGRKEWNERPPVGMDDLKGVMGEGEKKGLSPERLLGQGVSHAEVRRRVPNGI